MDLGMQDLSGGIAAGGAGLRTEDIRALTARMARVDRALADDERIDQIRAIEELVCAGRAAQARLTADFDTSTREKAAAAGAGGAAGTGDRGADRVRAPRQTGDGWSARPRPGPRHTIETTTPTGHTYVSVAPRSRPESKLSPAELGLVEMIWAA